MTRIEEIVEYVEKHININFDIDVYNSKFIGLINNEKGLNMIIYDKIKCNFYKYLKFSFIIEHSNICVQIYDFVIKNPTLYLNDIFDLSCRYDLIDKLYNYIKNVTHC